MGKQAYKREYLTEYELEIHQLDNTIKEMSEILKALDREPVTDMISRPAETEFQTGKTSGRQCYYGSLCVKETEGAYKSP